MYDRILQHVAQHIRLTDSDIAFFQSVLKHRTLRKRQYLSQAGEVCRYENFVTKGLLRAYSVDADGQEHVVMFAMEGWWITDLYSFLSGSPATQNVDALEDSEVL